MNGEVTKYGHVKAEKQGEVEKTNDSKDKYSCSVITLFLVDLMIGLNAQGFSGLRARAKPASISNKTVN